MAGPTTIENRERRISDDQQSQNDVSVGLSGDSGSKTSGPKLSRAEFLNYAKKAALGVVLAPLAPRDLTVYERGRKPLEATISAPDAVTSYNLEIAPETVPEMPDWLQRVIQGAAGITGLGAEAAVGYYVGIYLKTLHDNPGQPEEVIQTKFHQSLRHPLRRDFLAGAGGAASTVGTLGCEPVAKLVSAFNPPTTSPKSNSNTGEVLPTEISPKSSTKVEATQVQEVFKSQSIRTAVTAFREADKIPAPYPNEQEVVVIGGSNPVKLRVKRLGDDEFEIGPKGNSMNAKFLPDRVSVLLPFDSLADRSNGMATIVETAGTSGTKFVNYIVQKAREKGLLNGEESIQYPAAGSSGAALRGHAVLVNVLPNGDEWIMTSPWLTNKNVVSNWVGKGAEIMGHYKFGDGKEIDIPISALMARGKIIEVSVDGRYKVDGKSYGRILKGKDIDQRVIDAYEEVFIPPVLKGEWSSRKEGSDVYFDASKSFDYVGSKAEEHAYMLDLSMGTLNVGLMVKEDLIQYTLNHPDANGIVTKDAVKLAKLKEKYGGIIQNNQMIVKDEDGKDTNVQDQLMAIRRVIRNNDNWTADLDKNGYGNFVVIIDAAVAGGIAQVIRKTGKKDANGKEVLERYMWSSGKLIKYTEFQLAKAAAEGRTAKPEDLEFQLYSKSRLEVKDGKFWQDGKEVVLKGAVMDHFIRPQCIDNPNLVLSTFKQNIDHVISTGKNFVNLQINLGNEFIANKEYKRIVLDGIRYAKERGLIVYFGPRAMGKTDPVMTYTGNLDAMNHLDKEALKNAWDVFLSDGSYAKQLGSLVDIFGATAEPAYRGNSFDLLTWDEITSLFGEINNMIRERVGRQETICTYGAPRFSGNIGPVLASRFTFGNYDILEWHPYEEMMGPTKLNRNFENDLAQLLERKIPVLIGEMGWTNSIGYLTRQFKALNSNKVSYAYHFLSSFTTSDIAIVRTNPTTRQPEFTQRGYLSTYYGRQN